MTITLPPTNIKDSHTYNTNPHTTTSTHTTIVKLSTGREVRTTAQCLETVHTTINASNTPREAGTSDHNSDLWSSSTLFMDD